MKNFKFRINDNQYEVEVLGTDGNMARIEVNGTIYDVEMQREMPKAKSPASVTPLHTKRVSDSKPAAEGGAGKATEIKAPLPGVIIKLLVKQGEEVQPGQTLCTLETMKMENAIKTETAGKVTAVNIAAGQSVLQDEVLIVVG